MVNNRGEEIRENNSSIKRNNVSVLRYFQPRFLPMTGVFLHAGKIISYIFLFIMLHFGLMNLLPF
jgi:hypothetical protein